MKRYILTGTPGSGKTSLLRYLEMQGYCVIEEAATDIIALRQAQGIKEPWTNPAFINEIVKLQKQRQTQANSIGSALQFYDRSPIDAYALSIYLNYEPSKILLKEIERIRQENIYEKEVFFIENLGFCEPTEARKISFEEALRFEKIHEEVYLDFGYHCQKITVGTIEQRADKILKLIR